MPDRCEGNIYYRNITANQPASEPSQARTPWRAIMPILSEYFEIEEELYASILPTATPFARNALFGAVFPDELAEMRPEWWERGDQIGFNSFEDELFKGVIHKLAGAKLPTH